MTILVYLGVAFGAGVLGLVARRRPPISIGIGLAGLAAAVVASMLISPGERIQVGDAALVASDFQRLFLVFGSIAALAMTIMALAHGWQRNLPSAMLIGLGALGLGLALTDPIAGLAATAAAGLPGILVAITTPVDAHGVQAAARELRAVAVTGALAIVAAALVSGPSGLVSLSPTIVGLAYLAMAIAVAVRFGAIPFHSRVARVTGAAPGAALPLLLAWAPAGFASAALVWIDRNISPTAIPLDAERAVIVVVGLLCLVLGVLAASIQDDVEHVVGYSVIQDAGFVMLALTVLEVGGWEPARTWLLVYVATKSAFAGWAVAVHGAFGTGRIAELSGWARRAPLLAIALAAIVVATVGVPGLLVWDVRSRIADLSLGAPLALLGLAGGLGSLLYYGRLALVGVRPAGPVVLAYGGERPRGLESARRAAGGATAAPAGAMAASTGAARGPAGSAPAVTDTQHSPAPAAAMTAPTPAAAAGPVGAASGAAAVSPEPAGPQGRVERFASSLRQDPRELTQRWAVEALERAGLSPSSTGPVVEPMPGGATAAKAQAAEGDAGRAAPARRGPEGAARARRPSAAVGRGETAHALWDLNRSLVSASLAVLLATLGLVAAAGGLGLADAARAPAPAPGGPASSFFPAPFDAGDPGIGEPSATAPAVTKATPAPEASATTATEPTTAPAVSGPTATEPLATPTP